MEQNSIPVLIGSAEAARRLRMHRATFNKLVAAGDVPVAAEIPGKTGARLFAESVIDELAQQRTEVPA